MFTQRFDILGSGRSLGPDLEVNVFSVGIKHLDLSGFTTSNTKKGEFLEDKYLIIFFYFYI